MPTSIITIFFRETKGQWGNMPEIAASLPRCGMASENVAGRKKTCDVTSIR